MDCYALNSSYQGEVPEAILSAVSLIPIAGVAADSEKAAIQVTKAIQSASKINPANVQQLLARLTSKIQLFSDSHAKELLALQFGAELYMLLGEDEPESSLINSERGRDTQQRLSERGSILRLSLSDVQRLMLNVPTDKLKGIAKLLEKDVGVNVNKMPETVIHNPKVFIQYGLFLRKLGIKHWRSGELYHLDKFKKLYENNPNAIVSEQQHFFDLNAAGLTSGSLDDLRKPDVSIKNTGANGNIGYDLHEVKVGAIGKNERILSEIDRDCRMLNQGAKQRKNGVIVSAVVNKVVWNFYPSGGTESKVIFGLSDSLLDFLSCKKDKHGKPTDYGTDTKGIDIELFLPNSDAIKQFKLAQKSTEFRTESLGLINLDMDGTTDTSTSSGAIGGINSGSDPLSLITEERVLYTGSSYGEKQISFSLPDIVYSLTPVSLSVLEIPGYDLNSYQVTWEQIAGIAIDLTNSTSNSVSFIAPETLEGNEDIILRLSVINGNSVLTHDQIISIIPRLPITYSLETSDLNVIPTLKISFPEITDATQINIYYATEENVLPENWSLLNDGSYRQEICIPVATSENQFKADAGGEIAVTFCPDVFDVYFEIEGANIETETNFTLRSGQSYYFTLSSTINGEELIHDYNHRVTINSFDPEAETPLIPLNDTGITWGANYPAGNNTTCIGETIEEQDCSYGRDAQAAAGTLSKVGGGHAGFDFTKLDASGAPLTDQTQDYISNPWACVKDNHTGLVWEVKTDDDGIHDKDLTYRWGGKTALLNAPFGTVYNDWDALVDASNNKTFCGFSDWRVPSKLELTSIVNFNRILPAIETNFFPNTTSGLYWSASLDSDNSIAMSVYFKDGLGYPASLRYNQNHVRIVRGGE